MRMSTLRELVQNYRKVGTTDKIQIILKVWQSDGIDGIETLAFLVHEPVDQLSARAAISAKVARGRARRDQAEKRRGRQPVPKGFRRQVRDEATRAGHGRGFLPKRRWDPLH